jgi:hypothetical protein
MSLKAAAESAIRGDFFPITAMNCGKFPALLRQGVVPGTQGNFAVAARSFSSLGREGALPRGDDTSTEAVIIEPVLTN